jgi:hypothetical protein
LIHVLLTEGDVVFQIGEVVLVQHVVSLRDHTFHYMLSN